MTKRRWLTAATVASKTDLPVLPWQRGAKTRPAAFRHIQMHVAPRPKAIAARQAGRLIHDEDTLCSAARFGADARRDAVDSGKRLL